MNRGETFQAMMEWAYERAVKGDGIVRVGFTGTRQLNDDGREAIRAMLTAMRMMAERMPDATLEVVQGGCVGADAFVGKEAHDLGFRVHTILPDDRSQVATDWDEWSDSHEAGGGYRERNKRIVLRSALLFAVADYPERDGHSRRSGSWMTVRMAREAMLPMWLYVQH